MRDLIITIEKQEERIKTVLEEFEKGKINKSVASKNVREAENIIWRVEEKIRGKMKSEEG